MQNFEQNASLVYYVFNTHFADKRTIENDLVQEGMIGLWNACRNYNESRGVAFSTYATKCIRNAMMMYVRKEYKKANDVVSLEALQEAGADDTALSVRYDEKLERDLLMQKVLKHADKVGMREMINMKLQGKTQGEIASSLHMSPARVSEKLKEFYTTAYEELKK